MYEARSSGHLGWFNAIVAAVVLAAAALLLVAQPAHAATGDIFTSDVPLTATDGTSATTPCSFYITSEDAQTVQVYSSGAEGASATRAVSVNTAGALTIPQTVTYNEKVYTVTGVSAKAFGTQYPPSVAAYATYGYLFCKNLTSITLPDTVTSIGNYAFEGMTAAKINVPAGVTTIGTWAYGYTGTAGAITLPDNMTSVGDDAFAYCTSITKFTYGANSGSTTIGTYVLINDTGITEVILPTSYTTIPVGFLRGCSGITDVSQWLTGTYTTIGNYAFYGTGITSVTVKKGLTYGTYPFAGCTKLTTASVEEGLSALPTSCFYGCTSLVSLNLPNSYIDIPAGFLSYCSSLTSVDGFMRDGGTIGNSAFANCFGVTSITINPKLKSFGTNAFQGMGITSITLPSTVSYTSTNYMFANCPNLQSATLPDGAISVGTNCFSNCPSLRSVTLPSSVTSIAANAFGSSSLSYKTMDSSLVSVNLPEGLTSIGDYAFACCTSLSSITLPSTLKTIGSRSFGGCSSLTTVQLPKALTTLGNQAFGPSFYTAADGSYGWSFTTNITSVTFADGCTFGDLNTGFVCSGITSIAFPSGATTCSAAGIATLESVTIPATCTTLGVFDPTSGLNYATWYTGNTKFKNITFAPGSVCNKINTSAFNNCTALTSIDIPDSMTNIGPKAFMACTGLKSVGFGAFSNLTTLGLSAFNGCTSLETISLPNTMTVLPASAFYGCTSLRDVGLSNALTTINASAFYGCTSLTSMAIPSTTTVIGAQALANCTSLSTVKIDSASVNLTNSSLMQFAGDYALTKVTANGNTYYPIQYWRTDAKKKYLGMVLIKSGSTLSDCVSDSTRILDGSFIAAPYEASGWTYSGVGDSMAISSAAWAYAFTDAAAPLQPADVNTVFTSNSTEGVPVTYKVITDGTDGNQPSVQVGSYTSGTSTSSSYRAVPYDTQEVTIPADVTYDGIEYAVTRVSYCAFYYAAKMTRCTLPEGLIEISNGIYNPNTTTASARVGDSYAFAGCTSLKTLKIPSTVKRIGGYAGFGAVKNLVFSKNSQLTDLGQKVGGGSKSTVFPDSLSFMGYEIFNGYYSLRDVTVGAAATTGDYFNTSSNSDGGIYVDNIYWRSNKKSYQSNYPTAHPTSDWGAARYPSLVKATDWLSIWYYKDQAAAVNDCIDGSTHSQALGQVYIKSGTDVADASVAAGTMKGTSLGLVKSGTAWTYGSSASTYSSTTITDTTPITDTIYAYGATYATVSGIDDSYAYTGSAIDPTGITVKDSGGNTLSKDTDYTVSYGTNTDAGSNAGTVTITGTGDWTGSVTISFNIVKDASKKFSISGISDSYTYTGLPIQPTAVVKDGDTTLAELTGDTLHMTDADYEVTYDDNSNVGTATVDTVGMNKYTGTATKTFSITAMDINSSAISVGTIPTQAWTGSAVKPSVTVTNSNIVDSIGKVLTEGTDYTLTYLDSTGAEATPVDSGLYTVRITGKGNYTGSRDVTYYVGTDLSSASIGSVADVVWPGSAVNPTPAVTLGSTTLVAGTDFRYVYTGNAAVGSATVGVKGINAYTGEATTPVSFTISVKDLATDGITYDGNVSATYNKAALTPDFNVKQGNISLVAGTDYTVAYVDSSNKAVDSITAPGTYTATLTGKGNYTGTLTAAITVSKAALSADAVTGIDSSYAYTGQTIPLTPSIMLGSTELTEGTDYTLTYKDSTGATIDASAFKDPGSYTIIISGQNGTEGTVTYNVTIKRSNVNATWTRLSGNTALDTMSSVVDEGYANDSCDSVVVATTGGYWDALTASALAGLHDCPILLTSTKKLSTQTSAEITRLGAKTVYIAGGASVVSATVEAQIKTLAGVSTVTRLAGDTAIGTGLKIYEAGTGSWGDTAIVATSSTFQDALSISPYAYAKGAPVFLANSSTKGLSDDVVSAIRAGGFSRVIIVGGTSAVSSNVESSQLSGITCVRLAGATAYETSSVIANFCIQEGMSADHMGIATGASYYDALAGAALCGKMNSVLVLISSKNESTISGFVTDNTKRIEYGYIFGGTSAVSKLAYADLVIATTGGGK